MLLAALPVICCHHPEEDAAELSVSIHIPDITPTKAETGAVGPLSDEKNFSTLQLWVFLHDDGQLVGYKGFTAAQLAGTGIPHSAITRFGMPLSREMFTLLSRDGTTVDVYALANATSAGVASLGEGTTRAELDKLVLSGSLFGVSPLTMAVPAAGLPMSGVLKAAPVTGGYPVLNVSTVNLTRAVSKIRFVFSQQGTPATETDLAVPDKPACVIKSITFGGTSAGHDCQIAQEEKLFTANKYGTTDNPFDIDGYVPLAATLSGEGSASLVSNGDISVMESPEELLFRSDGHQFESAQEYEKRLDEAVASSSQLGPIYIRETDKLISGTIVYNVGEEDDVTATFYMPNGDRLTRNHSWILYAYFAETTKTLQFQIVVLPWEKSTYSGDFTDWTVNVIRRFTIPEKPKTYTKKDQQVNGYFDIYFWPPNIVKGDILIDAPVGQTLHIVPVAGVREGFYKIAENDIDNVFVISPRKHVIYSNGEHSEDCKIEFEISCDPGSYTDAQLEGNYVDLHFCVEIGDNERWIDLDSESLDHYRIYLKKVWTEPWPE